MLWISLKVEGSNRNDQSSIGRYVAQHSVPMELYVIIRLDWGAGSPFFGGGGGSKLTELTVKRCTVSRSIVTLQ